MKYDNCKRYQIAILALLAPALLLPATMLCASAQAPAAAASEPAGAALRAIHASTDRHSVTITLDISGSFTYTPTASGAHLLLVDLAGVSWKEAPTSKLVDSTLLSSYRAVSYQREGQPSVRLELLLKEAVKPDYRRTDSGLEIALVSVSAPAAAAAPASTSAARGSVVEKVNLIKGQQSASIQIVANGRLQYKAFELQNPSRLVVDIPGAVSHVSKKAIEADDMAPLHVVRVGQFRQKPPVTRVVLDLESHTRYDVRSGAKGLEIELRNTKSAKAMMTPAAPPTISVSAAMPAAMDSLFASARQLMASPRVELAEPQTLQPRMAPPAAAPMPPPMAAPAPATSGPSSLAMKAQAAQQPAQGRPAQTTATSASGKRYSGELISINVKDADIKDFFRLIHEISGLNVILDKEVRGLLSMVIDDVPWDQTLDIVLKNFQLDSVLEGNVLRIATLDTLKKEQKDLADMAKAQAATVDLVTVTRDVNYAKAEDIAPTLKKFLTDRAQVIADPRTNQLIITDIPQSIPTMDEVRKQIDKRTQQVEIEARIVSASRSFVRELGAQFGFGTLIGSHVILGGNPVGGNGSPITARVPAPVFSTAGGQAIPLVYNFPAAGANTGLTLSTNTNLFSLDAILTAAESRGIGKLLSRPKIVTQNNRKGLVQQGVKIPVQTTINNTVSTQFVDATLSMEVTPQITSDNTIFLEVDVKNQSIDPGIARINGIPALDTQEANTRVLVDNGGTVVFGGVISTQNNLTVQQVPLLGSIPVVGNLFKRTGISTSSSELLFFISPKVL